MPVEDVARHGIEPHLALVLVANPVRVVDREPVPVRPCLRDELLHPLLRLRGQMRVALVELDVVVVRAHEPSVHRVHPVRTRDGLLQLPAEVGEHGEKRIVEPLGEHVRQEDAPRRVTRCAVELLPHHHARPDHGIEHDVRNDLLAHDVGAKLVTKPHVTMEEREVARAHLVDATRDLLGLDEQACGVAADRLPAENRHRPPLGAENQRRRARDDLAYLVPHPVLGGILVDRRALAFALRELLLRLQSFCEGLAQLGHRWILLAAVDLLQEVRKRHHRDRIVGVERLRVRIVDRAQIVFGYERLVDETEVEQDSGDERLEIGTDELQEAALVELPVEL